MVSSPIESALPFIAALGLCTLRWVPVVMLVPIFAGHALNSIARTVVALALALPVVPGVAASLGRLALPLADWIALAAKEAALGATLATLIAAPFWAIEAAGTYVDYQRGGNPQALDPSASADASMFGAMLQQALVVFLIYTGGFSVLLDVVWTSYTLWPVLAPLPALAHMGWQPLGALLVAAMQFALTLAFPYLLALGTIEVCFALLSRVHARFPAYVAALPFKSVVLVLLIALTMPRLLDAAAEITGQRADEVRQWMRTTPHTGTATGALPREPGATGDRSGS
ncbi:EscT/YscT/HrcT family type III secretion system export apparatus protein [Paraburkholderia sp. T12-10]|nr:EscT/YscT/HrcT family type III secretion system export apparatus protein [Paraburkholderia sp. T12-10]